MARSTRERQEEEVEASRKNAERRKRIKEAREKWNSRTSTKPNIKPIVKKTMEEEREERREEREALKSVKRDLEQVREDRKFKVSIVTLDYLLKKKFITKPQYNYYRGVPEEPEDRKTITANGIVEIVNEKLLFYIL